jgi:hypothetical protein
MPAPRALCTAVGRSGEPRRRRWAVGGFFGFGFGFGFYDIFDSFRFFKKKKKKKNLTTHTHTQTTLEISFFAPPPSDREMLLRAELSAQLAGVFDAGCSSGGGDGDDGGVVGQWRGKLAAAAAQYGLVGSLVDAAYVRDAHAVVGVTSTMATVIRWFPAGCYDTLGAALDLFSAELPTLVLFAHMGPKSRSALAAAAVGLARAFAGDNVRTRTLAGRMFELQAAASTALPVMDARSAHTVVASVLLACDLDMMGGNDHVDDIVAQRAAGGQFCPHFQYVGPESGRRAALIGAEGEARFVPRFVFVFLVFGFWFFLFIIICCFLLY